VKRAQEEKEALEAKVRRRRRGRKQGSRQK